MLSPLELENKRVLTNKRKYDKFEMDEYLDMVFENYKALYNENEELKKQIKTLTEGIQYYRSIESTMQKALLLAEKTSKETKDAAVLKAEAIEKDANNRASQIIGTAEAEYTRIREKCVALVQQFNHYKAQLQVAANEQLRLITSATFEVETPEIENQQPVSEPVTAGTGMEAVAAAPEPVEAYTAPETGVNGLDLSTPEPAVNGFEIPSQEPAADGTDPAPGQVVNGFDLTPPEATPDGFRQASEPETASSVYSFTSSGNTQPLPDLSQFQPDVASFAPPVPPKEKEPAIPDAAPQDVSMQQPQAVVSPQVSAQPGISAGSPEKPVDISQEFSFDNGPIPDKTMILPDVKSVNREALRGQKPVLTEDMLNAETINLEDSIRQVRNQEQEPLQVPKREEPEILQIEPEPAAAAPQAQGLDSILQNMTIGKKKKNANGGNSQEDPFEFLGSVDDF